MSTGRESLTAALARIAAAPCRYTYTSGYCPLRRGSSVVWCDPCIARKALKEAEDGE